VICSSCGAENPDGARFCKRCGTRLPSGCPSCGALQEPDAAFCGQCGTPLGPDSSSAPVAVRSPVAIPIVTPAAERRLVSVLFADLVGFTTLAEHQDAEETRELLSRYFDLARTVIGMYGGTVEKFIGDAVMAVWGTPTSHEDDAERAVRAGLELVEAVHSLGPSIMARAGVMTGEAAVTIGALGQGMVAGDLVNTASRLQSVAAPGSVLVGDATMRASSAAITFEGAGEHALKGKSAPVPAWQALRVVAMRRGRSGAGALEAPFVGRDEELRQLKDLFHATSREGRARLVSILGPGGIGKSRLAWEFLKYIDGLVEEVWWHAGRSPAYGDGITFWALGEMVRSRCGLLETDDERTTRAKVAETLAAHVADETERRWIEPAILTLLGLERGVGPEQLFSAWRMFFERLAASGPVVLVFEDFHHADSGLIEFVDHMMEWSRNFPVMILTLARPELIDRRPDWGAGKRSFTSLQLEPLSDTDMRTMLAGLAPGLPPSAVRTIVERADGVPMYAVETVRMLVVEGKLVFEGGVYLPTGDLATLAVPDTLTALIASRLDALEPADRALVQDAAVLGQNFTPAGLAAVSGIPEDKLETRLRPLVRRELFRLESDPRSPERGQYGFVQGLIREVAYNTLAKKDRKLRHLAAARHFESLGTELAGALAGHYLAAYRSAAEGPEADTLAAQARVALRAAGDRAAALGSHQQAVAFYQEALTVTPDPAEQAVLHERAADSASALGCIDDAEAHFKAALETRAALGDRSAEATTTLAYARVLLDLFRYGPAQALLAGATDKFADLADDPALVGLTGQLARAYFLNDEHTLSISTADRVLEAAERLELVGIVADTLVTRGSALIHIGRRYEGIGTIEAGQRIAAGHGLQGTVIRALNNLAALQVEIDPRASLAASREGLALSRKLGRRDAHLLDNAFGGALRVGEWDWILAEIEDQRSQTDDRLMSLVGLSDLIGLRSLRGEPVDALLIEIEKLPTDERDNVYVTAVSQARAWAAFAAGRFAETRRECHRLAGALAEMIATSHLLAAHADLLDRNLAAAREDLAIVEGTSWRGRAQDADRASIRAGIAALEGRPGDALSLYRESMRLWRDLGLAWDEALCSVSMATLLDPSEPEVRAAVETGREVLVRLKARPFLELLDAAASRTDRANANSLHSGAVAAVKVMEITATPSRRP
jgi:class 3 adenylate cyclase/tetratricopeptide (TPR) repeat protein/ribosomal protein L40E